MVEIVAIVCTPAKVPWKSSLNTITLNNAEDYLGATFGMQIWHVLRLLNVLVHINIAHQ